MADRGEQRTARVEDDACVRPVRHTDGAELKQPSGMHGAREGGGGRCGGRLHGGRFAVVAGGGGGRCCSNPLVAALTPCAARSAGLRAPLGGPLRLLLLLLLLSALPGRRLPAGRLLRLHPLLRPLLCRRWRRRRRLLRTAARPSRPAGREQIQCQAPKSTITCGAWRCVLAQSLECPRFPADMDRVSSARFAVGSILEQRRSTLCT